MDETILWAVAISSGVLGLLLLVAAGGVVIYWGLAARRSRPAAAPVAPRPPGGDIAQAGQSPPPPAPPPLQQPAPAGNPWLWLKAWVFAIIHAATVSVVLGGVTFFEDLARADEEMQRTGRVSFPRHFLPGTLSDPAARKRLAPPGAAERAKAADPSEWEVVEPLES